MRKKENTKTTYFEETFDFYQREIEKEIQTFNHMTQECYMIERKLEEMNQHYSLKDKSWLTELKNNFWTFNDIEDFEGCIQQLKDIKPCVILADERWIYYRRLISSADYSSGQGRGIRLYVIDKSSDRLLGLIEVKSDFKNITSRDNHIGWNSQLKNHHHKLNNIAILSTLIPTPEFGFNVLGGKLIAFLSLSDVIRDYWKTKYNDVLEGVSTTSLYGHNYNGSIYTGNSYYKSLGHSNGDVVFTLPKKLFSKLSKIMSYKFPEDVEKINSGSNPKQRLMDFILKKYNISRNIATHGFKRGIYWSPFYIETNDHLNNRNLDEYTPRFNYTVEEIFEKWLPKSLNRFEKLFKENRLTTKFKAYEKLVINI